ncbi:MAG: hypothetical protein AB7G44_07080 [Bacteroidia bacterium]
MYNEELELTGVEEQLLGAEVDSELGAIEEEIGAPFTKAQRKGVKKFAAQAITRRDTRQVMNKGQKFLTLPHVIKEFDKQDQADIAAGKARFFDADYYLRKRVVGGTGQEELVIKAEAQSRGIKNFDKDFLPEGVNLAASTIRVAYGVADVLAATIPLAHEIIYTNAQDAETGVGTPLTIPAQLLNAELLISQDGKPVVSFPMAKFFRDSFSVGIGTQGNQDSVHMRSFRLLKGGKPFTASILWPEGSAALATLSPTNPGVNTLKHFVEVRLMGDATERK